MKVTVDFKPNDGALPERAVAEAEVVFGDDAGPLSGLKLVGFTIWRSPEDELYVTLPSRAFGIGSERRYFDFLRSTDGNHTKTKTLKAWVLEEWRERAANETANANASDVR